MNPTQIKTFSGFATTGIGSLPHLEVDQALDLSFQVDIPYFPTLPNLGPEEGMLKGWLEGKAWVPFLKRLEKEKSPWAKFQEVGPVTLFLAEENISPEVLAKQHEKILLGISKMLQAINQIGAKVLFFVDEPSLFNLDTKINSHAIALERLHQMIQALQQQGAVVGVHCCSDRDFQILLDLGIQVLSFDAAISLPNILQSPHLRTWLSQGGYLACGIIPTLLSPGWNTQAEVEKFQNQIQGVGDPEFSKILLQQLLLTPACGLGTRTGAEAESVFKALAEFKLLLQDAL